MFDIFLIFIIFCLLVALGIISGNYNLYKKKMDNLRAIYDGDWGKWSKPTITTTLAQQDMYDGSYIPEREFAYQERYHNVTGEYQLRYIY